MNRLHFLYCEYVQLHDTLVKWLTGYTSEQAAAQIARHALATVFRWACNAVQTSQGPYVDVAEQCLAGLLVAGFEADTDPPSWPLADLPPLDDVQHYQISHIYASVYAAQYEAHWTLQEREEVFMWIMQTAPVCMEQDQLEQAVSPDGSCPAPVRRALEKIRLHTCDGRLICAVTEQMWRGEHASSRTWMLAQMSREAIAPWPR